MLTERLRKYIVDYVCAFGKKPKRVILSIGYYNSLIDELPDVDICLVDGIPRLLLNGMIVVYSTKICWIELE